MASPPFTTNYWVIRFKQLVNIPTLAINKLSITWYAAFRFCSMERYGDFGSHGLESGISKDGQPHLGGSGHSGRIAVTDLLLVAVIVAFFLLAGLLVRACATVTEQSTDFELDQQDDEPESETVR